MIGILHTETAHSYALVALSAAFYSVRRGTM